MKNLLLLFFLVFSLAVPGAVSLAYGQVANKSDNTYVLASGDKVHVSVFGQADLTGDFVVDDSGNVQLPLVGQLKAAGLTGTEFQNSIANALRDQEYLKDPRVTVQISTMRPFYIMGEVNKPGDYPSGANMNVLNAVALAGGFTFRADDSVVYIRRKGETKEQEFPADQTTKIYPGDIVRVGERLF